MKTRPDEQPLTSTQSAVLKTIARSIRDRGFQPSLRELADRFGWVSASGALCHLKALEKKGYVEIPSQTARAIRIIPNWQAYV